MKYCPYCGASLVGGAASFCAECGKKIPVRERREYGRNQRRRKGAGSPTLGHRILQNGERILWMSITTAIMMM